MGKTRTSRRSSSRSYPTKFVQAESNKVLDRILSGKKSGTTAKWLTKTQLSILKNLHSVVTEVNDKIVVKRLTKQIEVLKQKVARSQLEITSSINQTFKQRINLPEPSTQETIQDDSGIEAEIVKARNDLKEKLARIDALTKSLAGEMPSRVSSLRSTMDAIESLKKSSSSSSSSPAKYSAKKSRSAKGALSQHLSK